MAQYKALRPKRQAALIEAPGLPVLVNIQKTMERFTLFHGKIHYFDRAMVNSYVELPEGIS